MGGVGWGGQGRAGQGRAGQGQGRAGRGGAGQSYTISVEYLISAELHNVCMIYYLVLCISHRARNELDG